MNKNNKNNKKKKTQKEINREQLEEGISSITDHPIFGKCYFRTYVANKSKLGTTAMGIVTLDGDILLNEDIQLTPKQWEYVIAHNFLHLAFGHFDTDKVPGIITENTEGKKEKKTYFNPLLWNMACDIYVDKFLEDIKFGQSVHDHIAGKIQGAIRDEITIYEQLLQQGETGNKNYYGTGNIDKPDMIGLEKLLEPGYSSRNNDYYTSMFTSALAWSVSETVNKAGGHACDKFVPKTNVETAASWFINSYPLLGGLASHFELVEDYSVCNKNDIHIAAIDVTLGKLYVNPAARLSIAEWKFVLAHEYLHAGLMHHDRCNGRAHYLWNVACDFVINGWLHEMQIGTMPKDGLLFDESLSGMSAESIYDLLLTDMRKYAKQDTLRGFHKGDILGDGTGTCRDATSLDDFCRSALQQGLEYQLEKNRGLIPAGLIEEIRALSMPPIPWDVALAKWFDIYFAPLEKHRSYARPSRRQACTPDIPRPRYIPADIPTDSRTFGVVIDTSGSMKASEIGKALGAIASYAVAHDVPFARVVFCDAAAYDAGYISPEEIAGRVQVKGRGGTMLQPGINKLEQAKDFPKDGPILIITDGEIERHLDIKHEHAFLLPRGRRLPFKAMGDVFYFSE